MLPLLHYKDPFQKYYFGSNSSSFIFFLLWGSRDENSSFIDLPPYQTVLSHLNFRTNEISKSCLKRISQTDV